jgi:drug/metabolite transporter (DMT)-like permease
MPLRDLLLILLICLVWAFNFVVAAEGMQYFSPLVFMALRFALVLLVLVPFLRVPPAGQWGRLVFVCLCIGALHFTTLVLGHFPFARPFLHRHHAADLYPHGGDPGDGRTG